MNADERRKAETMNGLRAGCARDGRWSVSETFTAFFSLRSSALICACVLFLSACAVGPDYRKPEAEGPGEWKEAADWKPAQPADTQPKGKWWEAFQAPIVSGLEEQVEVSNQQLQAALARYTQARAQVEIARASLFPALGYG